MDSDFRAAGREVTSNFGKNEGNGKGSKWRDGMSSNTKVEFAESCVGRCDGSRRPIECASWAKYSLEVVVRMYAKVAATWRGALMMSILCSSVKIWSRRACGVVIKNENGGLPSCK